MKKIIEVNINDYVIVNLNDDGKQILTEHFKKYGIPERYLHKEQEDGTYKFPMWEWMNIFGEYMVMGKEVPFDTNVQVRRT